MYRKAFKIAALSLSVALLGAIQDQGNDSAFAKAEADDKAEAKAGASANKSASMKPMPAGVSVMLTKFERLSKEPVLGPRAGKFDDAGAFNPAAARLPDGRTILLYRGQDKHGVSRVGYAQSDDGIHFKVDDQPVISPSGTVDQDGVEDPRLSRDPLDHKRWLVTATAYNKSAEAAQLVSYTSIADNLQHWRATSTVVPYGKGKWNVHWTKSGAMVTDGNGLPLKINGRFWMYYMGDPKGSHDQMGVVSSEDGVDWQDATDKPVLSQRPGMFDSKVVEPGPHTLITKDGILLIYNGADDSLTYRTGWALFDIKDPTKLLARAEEPLFEPEAEWEKKVASKEVYQAPNVVFVEGIVPDGHGGFRVYYGCADSYVGVAQTRLEPCGKARH
jgi:predicted GH43/DUF377 family glycosyl hydrolase